MRLNLTTAILIFSRFACEEAKQKKYGNIAGAKGGRQLARQLIQRTTQQARLSGIPYFTCFSDQQYGDSFGEKLANAVGQIFQKGFSSVIISGTDSPSISSNSFHSISKNILYNQIAISPAKDGGVCLIGIHKNAFRKNEFIHSIPWQTDKVLAAFSLYASQANASLATEVAGNDFDNVADVLEWIKENKKLFLARQLSTLIDKFQQAFHHLYKSLFFLNNHRLTLSLRGPPAFCF